MHTYDPFCLNNTSHFEIDCLFGCLYICIQGIVLLARVITKPRIESPVQSVSQGSRQSRVSLSSQCIRIHMHSRTQTAEDIRVRSTMYQQTCLCHSHLIMKAHLRRERSIFGNADKHIHEKIKLGNTFSLLKSKSAWTTCL